MNQAVVMWRHVYALICWACGAPDPAQQQPERERVMAGTGPDQQQPPPRIGPAGTVTLNVCDRCGAQAFVVWERDAEELRFCHHHSRQHATSLHAVGFRSQLVNDVR